MKRFTVKKSAVKSCGFNKVTSVESADVVIANFVFNIQKSKYDPNYADLTYRRLDFTNADNGLVTS